MRRAARSGFVLRVGLAGVVMIAGCFASIAASACGPWNYPSVHFNSAQPDFGAPPRPLSIESWGEARSRPTGCPPRYYRYWNQMSYLEDFREKRGKKALAGARRLESAGRFAKSLPLYRRALTCGVGDLSGVRDREEVYRELRGVLRDEKRVPKHTVDEYLAARRDYESWRLKRSEERMKRIAANPRAGFLRPHALYVLGAIQYSRGRFKEAGAIFERVARTYRRSARREAALIMVARSLVRSPLPKDEFPETWADKPLPKADAALRSKRALQALLSDYPHTRFRLNALGWLARCDYVLGRRVEAMEAYLRQYGTFTRESDRVSAAASVYFTSRKLTPADAGRLRRDLRRDTGLLAYYLDFRLYQTHGAERDLGHLADLATQAGKRGRLRLPARISARLAEIQYLRGRYRGAVAWASRALSSSGNDGQDLALYVRGAARRKLGRGAASESDFRGLLRRYPKSYLCGGARENLALLCERRGRPDLALDQYFRLNYRDDIAFILDVRMTTRQVAAYVRAHPRHPRRQLLLYTLGIRQLRDDRLAEAARTLSRLPDRAVRKLMSQAQGDYWWQSVHTRARDPRKTARDLAHLERAVRKARGSEARAGAMYVQASYIYQNRDLLFYNAALWQGERSVDFGELWDPRQATARDQLAVRKHHHEHECLYRARTLCLDLAKRYPKSPYAPKALYRAACATRYLADFNYWWRQEADRMDLWSQSVRLMTRVYRDYPHDALARPARKYAKVFASAGDEASRMEMFRVAKR